MNNNTAFDARPRELRGTPVARPDMRRRMLKAAGSYGIFIVAALVVVISSIVVSGFATGQNVIAILNQASAIGIVAVGMTFVVISANYIDLSVVAQVAISAVCVMAVGTSTNVFIGFLAGLGACLLYGFVNGIAIGVLRANAVVVTLGTNGVGLGLLSWMTKGTIFYGKPDGFTAVFGRSVVWVVPAAALVLLVIAAIGSFLLSRTVFGFSLRSLGSNREASRLVGVKVGGVVTGAFLVSSVCSALAGLVLASFSNTAVSTMSSGYDFSALAAVIVGGNSLFGGKGSVPRTLIGVVLIAVVENILVLIGLPFAWQQLVTGSIIVAAVAIDAASRKAGL